MTTPSAADDTHLQPAVAAEFASLAGLLAGISETQWDTPSMCQGWRVREVVAHMTMPARYSQEEFMTELSRCEFDFTRLSNEVASRDASRPADELVASLRSGIMQRWTPPGGGYHGALTHVVIHGLDVTVPLGAPRRPRPRPLRDRHQRPPLPGHRPRLVARLGPGPARRSRRPGTRAVRPNRPCWTARGRAATARLTARRGHRRRRVTGRASSQSRRTIRGIVPAIKDQNTALRWHNA